MRQVAIASCSLGMLLDTGCSSLVYVPIAGIAAIQSGDGFVGRHSKFWTDIAYLGEYELIRDVWLIELQDATRGPYLLASPTPEKGSVILPKGTILRTDRIYRSSDGLNYEFIDYYATVMTGRLKGNSVVINHILRRNGNAARGLDGRYLSLIHSSSQAEQNRRTSRRSQHLTLTESKAS